MPNPDVYASHMSVLKALLNTHRPKRVLEYGAGLYSTPLFLSRPHVEQLVSVEPDPDWRHCIRSLHDDSRLHILAAGDFRPSDFDLVFIDNGQDGAEPLGAERAATIRQVLSQKHPIVVVHDAEVPEYATAIEEYAINFSVFPTAPDTCVIHP